MSPSPTAPHSPDASEPGSRGRERGLRKRENTRARLVEAAADVVAAKGIAGTRIDDVVKEAGFTRGAFYSNYSSLEEVLTEAVVARSEMILSTITEAVDAIEGVPTTDSLVDLLGDIRPQARTIYLITTEHTLHLLRNPGSPRIPDTIRQEFTARLAGVIEGVLARMGRRPTMPIASLTDIICLLFLDSIAQEAHTGAHDGAHDGAPEGASEGTPDGAEGASWDPHLRGLVEALILGLSEPLDEAAQAPDHPGPRS